MVFTRYCEWKPFFFLYMLIQGSVAKINQKKYRRVFVISKQVRKPQSSSIMQKKKIMSRWDTCPIEWQPKNLDVKNVCLLAFSVISLNTSFGYQPFTPQYQYASSPCCSLFISYSIYKENLSNNQELLWVCNHFIYSHDLNFWFRGETVRRNTSRGG